ncbi:guanylate kinase [bacterium]|nr:guanylate kinase [bacterium]
MLNDKERRGFLFVISSPSGGGKTTIYKALLAIGNPFAFSISVTTRKPRKGEIDGIHYHFIDDQQFTSMIENDELAEWAEVHGYHYGTPRVFVEEAFMEGKIMILEIDVQGAMQLKEHYGRDAVLVFIAPPSIKETERRLRARASNEENDIAVRLNNAKDEIKKINEFDYLVFNNELDDAISDVTAIAQAEHLSYHRFSSKLWPENE